MLGAPTRLRSLGSLLLPIALGCASRSQAPTAAPVAAAPVAPVAEPAPSLPLSEPAMHATITALADDAMGGRYTLAEEIRGAAAMIAKHYRELGIASVGPQYEVDYPIATGAKLLAAPKAIVHGGNKARKVEAKAFTASAFGASKAARGKAVFVGYAAKADPVAARDGDESTARPGYDDLAGIDLTGKVAILFPDTPGRPDIQTLFERLRKESERFGKEAKPLRDEADAEGMRKLHVATRERIAALLTPFLRGEKLPADFTAAPSDPMTDFELQGALAPVMALAAKAPGPQFGFDGLAAKLSRLEKAGAVGAIVVRGPRSFLDEASRKADALPKPEDAGRGVARRAGIPVLQMKWKSADKLLAVGGKSLSSLQTEIDTSLTPRSAELPGVEIEIETALEPVNTAAPNVLATLPGTERPQEVVVFGAHFDHIGSALPGKGDCQPVRREGTEDKICNGADDNASGTAMVMELARALVTAGIKPKRTLVFAHFSGEELGLFGSQALAESPPPVAPFAGGKIVAMVNLDMVGRLGPRGLAVGGVGSSPGWMPLLRRIGNRGIEVTYERSITSRSDHANFYKKDIPVLFFFTQTHTDYHRATDHVADINREGMAKIGDLLGSVALALADGLDLPFSPPKNADEGLVGRLPGSNPATVEKVAGD